MSGVLAAPGRPRWLAREVVQTSSMDCGPAALKCVLDGYGIETHYGRLREACQTSIDGTSIDTLEEVARQLGLQAEQVMVPADQLVPDGHAASPAIVVVRHADQSTHFVVVWRRVGRWVQLMDPAAGRRWTTLRRLQASAYRHETVVDAADWRAWAASAEHRAAQTQRLRGLGLGAAQAAAHFDTAAAEPGWRALAALDAAVRLVHALVDAGGTRHGAEAARLLAACLQRCRERPGEALRAIPAAYWSVLPDTADATGAAGGEAAGGRAQATQLRLRGAVVLRLSARRGPPMPQTAQTAQTAQASPAPAAAAPLSAELSAALRERSESVWLTVWRQLRADGRFTPAMLALVVALSTAAVGVELLLLRGMFDLSTQLVGTGQRLAAATALLGLLLLLGALEWPTVREVTRLGRHLELRLRAALLERLPRLHDRYFQSRPISDMAERAHGIQLARGLPGLALGLLQSLLDLALTLAGLAWLAPDAAPWALAMGAAALAVPLAAMPLLGERDLRVRTQAAALSGFYLDALLGLLPVRAHRAERAVQREHEVLLVAWTRSLQGWIRGSIAAGSVQGALSIGLAAAFVLGHFRAQGGVLGSDLLLVFWTLKIPALGGRLAGLLQQVPAQRNALMRLLEPLSAPVAAPAPSMPPAGLPEAWGLRLSRGSVRAGGHEILREVDLQLRPGEHVAVVGLSGAGKSSLVGLLLGWHRLAAGTLQVGTQVFGAGDGGLEALRPHIAWVDPAVQLWNRSLLDNLLYASDDDGLDRIGMASGRARLREVAARLPQGLQTLLGEGGALLSGGEGQRVRLARALLQDEPRLVLLDEPFRGLDRGLRRELLAEARGWWRSRTLLCVTHDVVETLDFARVLVVQDGRIVEDGVPARLAATPSRYRELLQADAALQGRAWHGGAWRRLSLHEGRLTEAAGLDGAAPR